MQKYSLILIAYVLVCIVSETLHLPVWIGYWICYVLNNKSKDTFRVARKERTRAYSHKNTQLNHCQIHLIGIDRQARTSVRLLFPCPIFFIIFCPKFFFRSHLCNSVHQNMFNFISLRVCNHLMFFIYICVIKFDLYVLLLSTWMFVYYVESHTDTDCGPKKPHRALTTAPCPVQSCSFIEQYVTSSVQFEIHHKYLKTEQWNYYNNTVTPLRQTL